MSLLLPPPSPGSLGLGGQLRLPLLLGRVFSELEEQRVVNVAVSSSSCSGKRCWPCSEEEGEEKRGPEEDERKR